ncbi:MAG: hypothetical protein LLG20_04065 [Acidobacteriales bacterium]|nr:hypothetical protein [Terriglobales bacterium]
MRKRRIRGLEAELTRYEQMSSSDRYLFLHLIHRLAAALSMTVVAGSILVVMTYWSFVDRYALMFAYPYLVLCSNMFIPVSHICMRAKDDNFERIKAKTRADIERLRGRLSDASSCYHD